MLTQRAINAEFKKIENIVKNELYSAANKMSENAIKYLSRANQKYNERLVNEQSEERKRVSREIEVNVFKDSKEVKKILDKATKENVRLINDIPDKMVSRLSKAVMKSYESGLRAESLAKKLEKELGIADRRAKLIARDQLSKLNGELTKVRQVENGIESFIWRTTGDERVRDAHEELNGQEFTWKDGAPGEGIPGEPVNCRCYAEPVF